MKIFLTQDQCDPYQEHYRPAGVRVFYQASSSTDVWRMGCCASKEKKTPKGGEKEDPFEGTHVAKQNVTLWTYGNGGNMAVPSPILKGDLIEVVFCH